MVLNTLLKCFICQGAKASCPAPSAFAVPAELHSVLLPGNLGAVADQEAGHAGELVLLWRNDGDYQFFGGEVRSGKIDAFGGVGLVEVEDCGLGACPACLKGLQRLGGLVVVFCPRRVVVGSHVFSCLL